jgi:hypothetical protein
MVINLASSFLARCAWSNTLGLGRAGSNAPVTASVAAAAEAAAACSKAAAPQRLRVWGTHFTASQALVLRSKHAGPSRARRPARPNARGAQRLLRSVPAPAPAADDEPPRGAWHALGLHPDLSRRLWEIGSYVPTPVQRAAVPRILNGQSVALQSPTGSGKVRPAAGPGAAAAAAAAAARSL